MTGRCRSFFENGGLPPALIDIVLRKPEKQIRTVTIAGGGSSTHVLIPFLSGAGFTVNLLTRRPEDWSRQIETQLQSIDGDLREVFRGSLAKISDDPAEVVPEADVVVLCMPVCKYRVALHGIAPHLARDREVSVGTIYGQAGFNWMVGEIGRKFDHHRLTAFAVGLIPWICRVVDYDKVGVTYGSKAVNVVAVSPPERFEALNETFLPAVCERSPGAASPATPPEPGGRCHCLGSSGPWPPSRRGLIRSGRLTSSNLRTIF